MRSSTCLVSRAGDGDNERRRRARPLSLATPKHKPKTQPDCPSTRMVVGMCMRNHNTQIRCHGRRKIDLTAPAIAAFEGAEGGGWLMLGAVSRTATGEGRTRVGDPLMLGLCDAWVARVLHWRGEEQVPASRRRPAACSSFVPAGVASSSRSVGGHHSLLIRRRLAQSQRTTQTHTRNVCHDAGKEAGRSSTQGNRYAAIE